MSIPQNSSPFTIYLYHRKKYRFMDLLLESFWASFTVDSFCVCAASLSLCPFLLILLWCFLRRFRVMSVILVTGEPLKCPARGSVAPWRHVQSFPMIGRADCKVLVRCLPGAPSMWLCLCQVPAAIFFKDCQLFCNSLSVSGRFSLKIIAGLICCH